MNGSPRKLSTKELYDIIYNLSSDFTKTKEIFTKCFDKAVYDKIKKYYDTKLFFEYLRKNKNPLWRNLLERVNKVIQSNSTNYDEEIEQILDLVPNERTQYTIDTILNYTKKILQPNIYNILEQNLRISIVQDEDSLNNIFTTITGRDYYYFLDRYDYYINKKYIEHLFNKWKAPKFVIKPGTTQKSIENPKIGKTIIQDEKMQKIQQMVEQQEATILGNDKDTLQNILQKAGYNLDPRPLFSFWQNNMYQEISGKRPKDRLSLLAATVWVYLKMFKNNKKPISEFLDDPKKVTYAKGMYNRLDPKYFTVEEDYEKILGHVREVTGDEGLVGSVRNELVRRRPKYKSEKEEIVYDILKPVLRGKITKTIIRGWV